MDVVYLVHCEEKQGIGVGLRILTVLLKAIKCLYAGSSSNFLSVKVLCHFRVVTDLQQSASDLGKQ